MVWWQWALVLYAVAAIFSGWLRYLPLWAFVNLFAYVFAPVLVFCARPEEGFCDNASAMRIEPRLPWYLSYCQTPDNSLLGDSAWCGMEAGHWPWRAKLADWPHLQSYLGMLGWLWRNPAYGLELGPLGAKIKPYDQIEYLGNPQIKDGDQGVAGYCLTFVGDYWGLVLICPLWSGLCLHQELGWKLKTYAEEPARVATEPRAQYVVSVRFSKFTSQQQ